MNPRLRRFALLGAAVLGLIGELASAGGSESPGTYAVQLGTPGDVEAVEERGIRVDARHGDRATVYATPGQRAWLEAEGFNPIPVGQPKGLDDYPGYDEVASDLAAYAKAYPAVCRLESIGVSVQGRDIWAAIVSDQPDLQDDEPEARVVSTLHGDEPLGAIVCLDLIARMLGGYGVDETVTALVDETEIWVVPILNPDGYVGGKRSNALGVDLNRDFPEYPDEFAAGTQYDGALLITGGRQPETVAIMEWTAANSFVLSAQLHTGSLVANYPYDDDGGVTGVYQAAPDDLLLRELAMTYSSLNPPMFASAEFPWGITNGAAWYVIRGGMQDWNYRYAGCIEITFELSEEKAPAYIDWPGLLADNRDAMLAYLGSVHRGVRGVVTNVETGEPVYAQIRVAGNEQPVFTDPDVGDYHRLLLEGEYDLTVQAVGYKTAKLADVSVDGSGPTRLDVALVPATDDEPDPEPEPEPEPEPDGEGTACPFEIAFAGSPAVLRALRDVRDHVLSPTAVGSTLVQAYYRAAPTVSGWMRASRGLVGASHHGQAH